MTILTQLQLLDCKELSNGFGPFISRQQAKQKGISFYYLGTLCKHGHLAVRYTSTGQCSECLSARSKTEEAREYQRQRAKLYVYTEKDRQRNKARYRRNNPVARIFHLSPQSKRVAINLRNRINGALSGINKSASTHELLGCSVDEFVSYLESKFTDGMTWENRGRSGWHIDHIRPCATFDLTDPEQQRQCFHYTNLQPLWAKHNLSKGSKLELYSNQDAH